MTFFFNKHYIERHNEAMSTVIKRGRQCRRFFFRKDIIRRSYFFKRNYKYRLRKCAERFQLTYRSKTKFSCIENIVLLQLRTKIHCHYLHSDLTERRENKNWPIFGYLAFIPDLNKGDFFCIFLFKSKFSLRQVQITNEKQRSTLLFEVFLLYVQS